MVRKPVSLAGRYSGITLQFGGSTATIVYRAPKTLEEDIEINEEKDQRKRDGCED
jgi:hypothetical protein